MGIGSNALRGVAEVSSAAARYLPEPAAKGVGLFRDVMGLVSDVEKGDVGGVPTEALGDFAELIQMQIEVQKEMQTTTMVSNIEKSRHETKMAPIRNIRAG